MNSYFGSLARHLLTTLGGGLVTIGVQQLAVTNLIDAAVPVVVGLISCGVGQGLSLLRVRLAKKKAV